LDGTEYVLTGGSKCVIFQFIDDHSRLAVASHVAWGQTADGAITVVDKAIAAHGVPQRLLSDNGVALNPSWRGYVRQLVAHVSALGVEAITGRPYKATSQASVLIWVVVAACGKAPLALDGDVGWAWRR
jgi:transposase InsO family protein